MEMTWRNPHCRVREGRCQCGTKVPMLRRPVGQHDVADRPPDVLQRLQHLAGRRHRRMQLQDWRSESGPHLLSTGLIRSLHAL